MARTTLHRIASGILRLILPVLLLGPAMAETDPRPAVIRFQETYSTLEQADDERDAGRLGPAARLYRDALESYTQLSQLYPDWQPGVVEFRLAYCNDQLEAIMRKLDMSMSSLDAIPMPEPSRTQTRKPLPLRSARALILEGRPLEARDVLMTHLQSDPDNAKVRLLLGIAQCQAGLYSDAMFLLEGLVQEYPKDPHAHLALGAAYLGIGEIERAQTSTRTALRLDPNLAEAHYNMARLLARLTPPDIAKARDHYQKAVAAGTAPDKELEALLKR